MPRPIPSRREPSPAAAVRRAAASAASSAVCEQLETRRLLSTIAWINRGTGPTNDTDGFNALFGGNATQARLLVDRAIVDWEEVIVNFNYNGGGNTFNLTVQTADLTSIADGQVTAQNAGKPTAGRVRIDSTGSTHYIDPTAGDDAEFDDNITNAFTGYANTPPITGVDLYATVLHEIGHVVGISSASGLLIRNFITDTGIDDPQDSDPGNLQAFNVGGGPIEATFTNADPGHLWEGPGNTATNNAGLPAHPDVLMNSGRAILPQERNLISDLEAAILRDAYGYTVTMPSTLNNMLVNPNFTTDVLTINGQPGNVNDLIIIQGSAIPGALHVTVGTVGGGPQYTEIVPLSQVNAIVVNGGDGNDIIRVEFNDGNPTTLNGGNGDDFFDFAFGTRNLSNITGGTTVNGGGGNDSVFTYDNANAAASTYSVSSVRFDRPGWGGFFYANDLERLTLTTGTAANVVNVPSTFPGQPVVLNSAGGNDVVNLGSPTSGLQLIRSDVQIQNDPAFTTININDTGNAAARNATMDQWAGNFGALAGLAQATITWDNADVLAINVTTGAGDDVLNVLRCSERLTLASTGGRDNITLGNNTNGLTAVTGAVNVGPNTPFVFSDLTLNDTGNTAGRTTVWAVNGNGFFLNGLAPQQLRYENVLQLNVRGGTGPDHYALGGVFDDNITIDGGGGAAIDSLAVDDRAFPATLTYADIGPNFMTRGTGGIFNTTYSVGYSGIESPLFYAQDSATSVNVYGSPASIPAGQQMTVIAGNGSDTITLHLRDAQGARTLNGTLGIGGGNGTDSLVISDTGSTGGNYTFQNLFGPGTTNISGLGPANFGAGANVENITFSAGSGDDTFDIHSFQSGSSLVIRGNDGADTVNWTPSSRNTETHVTAISHFTFDGGNGGDDSLNFFNDNNTSGWIYTRNNAAFSATRAIAGYFLILNDPNVETVYATGGAIMDTINIRQVRPGTRFFVDGAGANDEFIIGNAQRTQDIRGTVGVFTSGGFDGVVIDNRADSVGRTFHVGAFEVGAAAGDDLFGPGGKLEFGGLAGLTIRCGSGSDNAFVLPHPTTHITVELNGQVPGRGSGDLAAFALAGAEGATHIPTGPGAGWYVFSNREDVVYNGAEAIDVDDVAPLVTASSFEVDLPRQTVQVSFSEDVSSGVRPASLTLRNLTTNQTIDASNVAVSYDTSTNTASFTFPGFANGVLPDGDYEMKLAAGSVSDLYGNPLSAEHTLDFFFLQADANRDRRVNLADFNILAVNFGQSNRNFGEADFNYDGTVNLADFNILATRFGNVLEEPAARGNGGELVRSPFSKVRIGDVVKSRHSQRLVTLLNEQLG